MSHLPGDGPLAHFCDKAGLTVFKTSIGGCALAYTPRGLRGLALLGPEPSAELRRLADRCPDAGRPEEPAPDAVAQVIARLQGHLDGELDAFLDLPLDLDGLPPFTQQVLLEARSIPPGSTARYNELALRCGSPGASRAVGQIMANNPLPLLVPCHRVLRGDGSLGGYSAEGGIVTKLRLLTLEGADLSGLIPGGVRHVRAADPRLDALVRRIGPYTLHWQQRRDHFQALVETIVHQQVSMKAGATIFGRVKALCSDRSSDLTPDGVLARTPEELREAGLSRQKASYVQDLARRTVDGSLPLYRLHRLDDARVVEELTRVKGLGVWSAEMFLMFRLGRLDVLPVSDLGLQKGVQALFALPELPGPRAIRELLLPCAPFRSLATWYLWRALDQGGL